jgi:hypothetical protein
MPSQEAVSQEAAITGLRGEGERRPNLIRDKAQFEKDHPRLGAFEILEPKPSDWNSRLQEQGQRPN